MTTTTVDKQGKEPPQAVSKGPLSFALVVVVAPSLAKTNCFPEHMYNDLAATTATGVKLHHCEGREPPQATSQRKGQPPQQEQTKQTKRKQTETEASEVTSTMLVAAPFPFVLLVLVASLASVSFCFLLVSFVCSYCGGCPFPC